ncbi:MAG: hypothetical protein QW478_08835 [Candidatus Micrarchaeaceae archaeon]
MAKNDEPKTIHGNLVLRRDTTFEGDLIVEGNITGNFNLYITRGSLIAKSINVRDLDASIIYAKDISAYHLYGEIVADISVTAHNIDVGAHNIYTKYLKAWDIYARDIIAKEISARSIVARYVICDKLTQPPKTKNNVTKIIKMGYGSDII